MILLALALGALNPAVTQATIAQTICVPGWSATVRPPKGYTSALKRKQMHALNLPGKPSDYEEDHFIPLSIGGAPSDQRNLWPQPWPDAKRKDRLEGKLHRLVCSGDMTLRQAQTAISHWKMP